MGKFRIKKIKKKKTQATDPVSYRKIIKKIKKRLNKDKLKNNRNIPQTIKHHNNNEEAAAAAVAAAAAEEEKL